MITKLKALFTPSFTSITSDLVKVVDRLEAHAALKEHQADQLGIKADELLGKADIARNEASEALAECIRTDRVRERLVSLLA